jgi:D-arginine dehydrogenase
MIADAEHAHLLDDYLETWRPLCPDLVEVDPVWVRNTVPILRPERVARVVSDPYTRALDVHRLLEGYRRHLLGNNGVLRGSARVDRIERHAGHWQISFGAETLEADIVVNAAGAWGDEIGRLAGAQPLGLTPYQRTAVLVDPGQPVAGWPMVHRIEGGLYFKPDAGVLMVSLADATPSPPCDAQPDELDLAVLIDRFESATTVSVRRPGRSWAGLRTFLPDQVPAVGFDARLPGFFWLVGQGGFGVQTAPAVAAIASTLLTGGDHPLAATLNPGRCADF